MMKLNFSLLFCWPLLATPVAVQAQFTYTNDNGTITITGYNGANGAVDIPATINGLSVTSIGNGAFAQSRLTSVTIPTSVTNIGDVVFTQSTLSTVTIPDSVRSIGNGAFNECGRLTSVGIPKSVTSIGGGAFYGCSSLVALNVDLANASYSSVKGVLLNKSQTMLIQYPIGNADSSYSVPNNVTNINEDAFQYCYHLTEISVDTNNTAYSSLAGVLIDKSQTKLIQYPIGNVASTYSVPNGVTSIRSGAFWDCTNLTNLILGDSVTSIVHHAFLGCSSLSSVTIANSVRSIGVYAFFACDSLTNVTIGNGVTSIGTGAFSDCLGLDSVTIPSSVINLGGGDVINNGAFQNCYGLTRVYFKGHAPSADGTVFAADPATVYYLPGTIGWSNTFAGLPAAPWTLPYPVILASSSPSFGVESNPFSFTVSWATNLNVVVEASTDLANPVWTSVATNALTSGSFYFSDPQRRNYPNRFYRIRSQ